MQNEKGISRRMLPCRELILVEKCPPSIYIGEETAEPGLFNRDLQSLVSKLQILRGFNVPTSDILLAECIAEEMQKMQEEGNIDIERINNKPVYCTNFLQDGCIEFND